MCISQLSAPYLYFPYSNAGFLTRIRELQTICKRPPFANLLCPADSASSHGTFIVNDVATTIELTPKALSRWSLQLLCEIPLTVSPVGLLES